MPATTFSKMRVVTCGRLMGIAQSLFSAWGRVFQLQEFRLRAICDVCSNISRRHSSPLKYLSSLEELAKEITSLHACKQMISWMHLGPRFYFKIHIQTHMNPIPHIRLLHIVYSHGSCVKHRAAEEKPDRFIVKVICLLLAFHLKKILRVKIFTLNT